MIRAVLKMVALMLQVAGNDPAPQTLFFFPPLCQSFWFNNVYYYY